MTQQAVGSPGTDRAALGHTRFASLPQWRQMRVNPMCTWLGVDVDSAGRVVKLDLHGKGIKCSIPVKLCELDALVELVLYTNRLSGTIPAQLGELSKLQKLDLWDNFLEGPIPKTLGKLTALRELHLSGNFLTGRIPKQLGRLCNLTALYLHGNKLSGEIPAALGSLTALQKLVLINNRLTGSIPVELSQLKVVVEINLANNRLSGPIPAELGQLGNLAKLYLWGNNLSGSIPEELGQLSLLEKLDLAQNNISGGIPRALRKHPNFRRFVFSVPEDGAPVPPWRSRRSLLPALLLGYLDLASDLAAVASYRSQQRYWFVVGLVFIFGPSLVLGAALLRKESARRGVAVMVQVGLLVEAYVSIAEERYSHVIVALRLIGPLFESLPQLLLQTYVLLVDREFLALRVFSVAVSALSLAAATTGVVAEHPLSQVTWAKGVDYPTARCTLVTSLFFGTIPCVGSVVMGCGFRLHPQDFVWWFLAYEVLEVVGRFLSLAVAALVLEYYLFVLLAWFWFTRWTLSRISIGRGVERENLHFRALVRSVGMPFMDAVIDRVQAYKVSCFFTCMETACCLAVGNALEAPDAGRALASHDARRIFTAVALFCTVGKIILAFVVVVPFKETIGRVVPAVKGELRVDGDAEESPDQRDNGGRKTVGSAAVGGGGGGGGGGSDGGGGGGGDIEQQDIMIVIKAAIAAEVATEAKAAEAKAAEAKAAEANAGGTAAGDADRSGRYSNRSAAASAGATTAASPTAITTAAAAATAVDSSGSGGRRGSDARKTASWRALQTVDEAVDRQGMPVTSRSSITSRSSGGAAASSGIDNRSRDDEKTEEEEGWERAPPLSHPDGGHAPVSSV